jgi:hypothetical protein
VSRPPAQKKSGKCFLATREGWELLSNIATAAGIVIAIIGAGWVLFEYRNNQADERNRYTFNLIDSWEKQAYKAAYWDLRESYTGFLAQLPKERVERAETDDGIRRGVIAAFNASLEADSDDKRKIREVAYFFNKLNLCLDADLCAKETATVFFNDTVKSFLEVFGPYLDKNDADLPGGKAALDALSARLN